MSCMTGRVPDPAPRVPPLTPLRFRDRRAGEAAKTRYRAAWVPGATWRYVHRYQFTARRAVAATQRAGGA